MIDIHTKRQNASVNNPDGNSITCPAYGNQKSVLIEIAILLKRKSLYLKKLIMEPCTIRCKFIIRIGYMDIASQNRRKSQAFARNS